MHYVLSTDENQAAKNIDILFFEASFFDMRKNQRVDRMAHGISRRWPRDSRLAQMDAKLSFNIATSLTENGGYYKGNRRANQKPRGKRDFTV